jgi:hypothetical protein
LEAVTASSARRPFPGWKSLNPEKESSRRADFATRVCPWSEQRRTA